MPFQTEDRTDVWIIGEIDGVWGLNRDTPITRSHCRNRECGVNYGVENGNDLTNGVVARRDGYLFTIGVRTTSETTTVLNMRGLDQRVHS